MYDDEINTVWDLVQEVQNSKTGGYEVDFDIKPNMEKSRVPGGGFWTVITVESTEPGSQINGEWWFDADGKVMQVL